MIFPECQPEDRRWLRESGLEATARDRASVLEITRQGMFDSGEETEKLADQLLKRKGLPSMGFRPQSHWAYQEEQLNLLAKTVRESLDMSRIYQIMEGYANG